MIVQATLNKICRSQEEKKKKKAGIKVIHWKGKEVIGQWVIKVHCTLMKS